MSRFRWPRWGMLSYGVDKKLPDSETSIATEVRNCLKLGSPRILITADKTHYNLYAEQPKPNIVSFWIGIRHWWFHVRNGGIAQNDRK